MEHSRKYRAARAANQTLNTLVNILLLIILAVCAYALYDSYRVTNSVDRFNVPDEDIYSTFMQLRSENSDVVAWIRVDDTNISYPVLQSTDNMSYLNLNAKKEYSAAGSIFMDCGNASDFSDSHTMIYGHNMSGERMFADVASMSDESYFNSHSTGRIYLPDRTLEFEIVALVRADSNDTAIYAIPHNTEESMQKLIDEIDRLAVCQRSSISTSDKLITLSTCTVTEETGRYLAVCRVTSETPAGESTT